MLLKFLRGGVHVSGRGHDGHVLPFHMEMEALHSCHGRCTFQVRQSYHLCARARRVLVFLKPTLVVVDGVRLQCEKCADGDDVERQGEVGHAELAQKVAEGAAQVDAERIPSFSILPLPFVHNQ